MSTPSRNRVSAASNIVADKQLREAIAKALGLQKGVLPEVKKDAPANQHYYREHEVFDYDYEQVVSTDYSNAEKDINNILALFHTYGNRGRLDEARIIHNNLDHYFNIIERIQPGYKGETTIDVKSLQKVLCEHRDRLVKELNREVES